MKLLNELITKFNLPTHRTASGKSEKFTYDRELKPMIFHNYLIKYAVCFLAKLRYLFRTWKQMFQQLLLRLVNLIA